MEAVSNKSKSELKVFYDGNCMVCSKEIDLYKKKDLQHIIDFVDINSSSFNPIAEGLDPKKVRIEFHVKDSQGKIYSGVDGFVAIWDLLGIFRPLSKLAKSKLTRPLLDMGYLAFTKVRPFLPKNECADGSCNF